MAIFFAKYGVAVMQSFNAGLVASDAFVVSLSLAYGCFSGYFSSRTVNLVSKAKGA